MTGSAVAFEVHRTEPANEGEEPPALELDDAETREVFEGYRRYRQSPIVTAVREGGVVGMGAAWLCEQHAKPPLLWVRAAEVNAPYLGTGLERQLVDLLLRASWDMDIEGAYLPAEVRRHLAQ